MTTSHSSVRDQSNFKLSREMAGIHCTLYTVWISGSQRQELNLYGIGNFLLHTNRKTFLPCRRIYRQSLNTFLPNRKCTFKTAFSHLHMQQAPPFFLTSCQNTLRSPARNLWQRWWNNKLFVRSIKVRVTQELGVLIFYHLYFRSSPSYQGDFLCESQRAIIYARMESLSRPHVFRSGRMRTLFRIRRSTKASHDTLKRFGSIDPPDVSARPRKPGHYWDWNPIRI